MQSQVETTTGRNSDQASTRAKRPSGRGWSYNVTSWLGLVPFLLFCLLFEILPAIIIIQGSFSDNNTGAPTLDNYKHMFSQASNIRAFQTSIEISLVTALLGGLIGAFAAYAVYTCAQDRCAISLLVSQVLRRTLPVYHLLLLG